MKEKKSIHIKVDKDEFYALKEVFPIWGEMTFALRVFLRWSIKNPSKARDFVKREGELDEI